MREKVFKIVMAVTVVPGLIAGGAILALSLNDKPQPGPTPPVVVPTGIRLSTYDLDMDVGEHRQLTAFVDPEEADQKVDWSIKESQPSGCVKITSDGLVTANTEGTAVISACPWGYSSLSAQCEVKISKSEDIPAWIDIFGVPQSIEVGDEPIQLRAQVYSSEGKPIPFSVNWTAYGFAATVDIYGRVTAEKAGTATIRASAVGHPDIYKECTIEITESEHKPTDIEISTESLTIEADNSFDLTAQPLPIPEFRDWGVSWDVNNPQPRDCLEYEPKGNKLSCYAKKAGTATIIATAVGTTRRAKCEVTITPCAPRKITISKKSLALSINHDSYELTAKVEPEGAYQGIAWKSTDPDVATVDSWGNIQPKGQGRTEIIVESTMKDVHVSDSCVLDVVEPKPFDDEFTWDLIEGTKEAQIKEYTGDKTEIEIPSVVYDISGNPYPVVSLWGNGSDDGVFANKDNITSIHIPASITSIDQGAFWSIEQLQSITVDAGNPTYTSVVNGVQTNSLIERKGMVLILGGGLSTIPEGVTEIGYAAFKDTSPKNVTFPTTLTSIGNRAFENCYSLEAADISKTQITQIGAKAFYYTYITSLNPPSTLAEIGSEAFRNCNQLKSVDLSQTTIPEIPYGVFDGDMHLESIILPDSLTAIGRYAFYSCADLTSISIPDSVKTIDESAFRNAYDLKTVVFTENSNLNMIGELAFADCAALESFEIPTSVKTIERFAFNGCSSSKFTSVYIPENVETIGFAPFEGCTCLTTIEVDTNNQYFTSADGSNAIISKDDHPCLVQGCQTTTIPDNVESIGREAFYEQSTLAEISIPSSVKTIGESAFSGCSSLRTITLNYGLEKIDMAAFAACSELTSITLPESLITIGESSFSGCSSLKSIDIPDNITTISNNTFQKCGSLETVNFTEHSKITSIQSHSFAKCSSLQSINLPKKLTTIGEYCFEGCSALTTIVWPKELKTIEGWCFKDCTALTEVILPASVEQVLFSCFQGCTALTRIDLPPTLTELYSCCFQGCSSLESIVLPETIKTISSDCFNACIKLKSITLPNGIEDIHVQAFYGCKALTTINLPSSIIWTAERIFAACDNLKEIDMTTLTEKPEGWHAKTFEGLSTEGGTIILSSSITLAQAQEIYGCLLSKGLPDTWIFTQK